MLAKRWLILVAIFLFGTTTNSLSAWGQSVESWRAEFSVQVAQNTQYQGSNWLEKWLSGPLPGQPQQSATSNQEAMVSPTAELSERSDITLHRKSQEIAQRPSVPYNRGDIIGRSDPQDTPKRLSIVEEMRREPIKGFYVAGRVGASFLMDSTNEGQLLTLEATPDRAGFIGAGALGLNLGSGFLLEGEVSYTKSDLKFLEITNIGSITGINIGTSSVDGNVTALSFMANGAYEFRNQSGLTPYLKVGIGISSISANDVEIAGIKIVDDDDLVFAYQFGGGLNFALDERTSLDFAYRYPRNPSVKRGSSAAVAAAKVSSWPWLPCSLPCLKIGPVF